MNQEKISIIVPVYNSEKYLERCINSILEQTYTNFELILVDDGSKDNSLKICKKYADMDNRVLYIHTENNGVSSARNIGIEKATGNYIGFVDSDDIIQKEMYSMLHKSIVDNNTDISICNYIPNNNSIDVEEVITAELAMVYMFDKNKYRGYVCNKLYKKDLIDNQKFNKEIHICEDLLFNCEYLVKCKKVSIVNEKLYNYIKNENSAVAKEEYSAKRETSLFAYEKMIELFRDKNDKILKELMISYIKEFSIIYYLKKKNKIEIVKAEGKTIYKKIKKLKYIKLKEKIEVFIYFNFPMLVQSLRNLIYKIDKNRR